MEELYDLEKDPMEWTNLVQSQPEKAKMVIVKLKPSLPDTNAEEIPKRVKVKSVKKVDGTLKARRDLRKLK